MYARGSRVRVNTLDESRIYAKLQRSRVCTCESQRKYAELRRLHPIFGAGFCVFQESVEHLGINYGLMLSGGGDKG